MAGYCPARFCSRTGIFAFLFLLSVAAGCSKKTVEPGTPFPCTNAETLYVSASTSEVLIFPGMPGALTLTVEAVTRTVDGVDVAADVPYYFVDMQSDGIFEITSTTPSTDIALTRSGVYPIQVTATRCDSPFPLVARQEVFAFSVSHPVMIVRFNPSVDAPIRLQTPILVSVSIISGVNNPPLRLSWDWGDGASAAITLDQAVVNRSFQHAYAVPGVFPFRVEVKDVRGLKASLEAWVLSSVPTVDVFRIDVGREMRQHDFYTPESAVHPGTHVVSAAGASGLIVAHIAPEAATFSSRYNPAYPFAPNAQDVHVDDVHDIAYVAGGESGLYVLDVSDAVAPRLIFPRIFAPPSGGVNIRRVWPCGGRVFFSNAQDGVYAITLTSPQILENIRANPELEQSPWSFVRADGGDSFSPLLHLSHASVDDLDCPNERFVVVGTGSSLHVYDLDLFWGTGASPLLFSRTIQLVFPDQPFATIAALAVAKAAAPADVTVAVALLANGSAEYLLKDLDTASPSLSLKRHRITRRTLSTGAGSGFVSERHASVEVREQETFVFVDGLQSADALMIFDNANTAGDITQEALYEAGQLCTGPPAFGRFPDGILCRVGVGHQQTSVRDDGNAVWYADASGLSRFSRDKNQIASFSLPFRGRGIAIGSDEYWLFTDQQVLRFNRLEVEDAVLSPLQAVPLGVHSTGINVIDVQPRTGIHSEMLLIGESELRWFSTSATEVLAQEAVNFGVVSAGFQPESRLAGVIDSVANRLHIWQRSGDQIDKLLVSSATGYQQVFTCDGSFFTWRRVGDKLRIERFNTNNHTLQVAGEVSAGAFASMACNQHYFYVVELSLTETSWLKVVDRQSGSIVSQQALPISGRQNLTSVRTLLDGRWLGVQIRTRGTFFFDLSNAETPTLVGADFFAQLASGSMFVMKEVTGGLRYGVLSVGTDGLGTPQMLIKKIDTP